MRRFAGSSGPRPHPSSCGRGLQLGVSRGCSWGLLSRPQAFVGAQALGNSSWPQLPVPSWLPAWPLPPTLGFPYLYVFMRILCAHINRYYVYLSVEWFRTT